MSIYDRANEWFGGLDEVDRLAVMALDRGPLPTWVVASLTTARIATVAAVMPAGDGHRSVVLMTTLLSDFLTHEGPQLSLTLRPPPHVPARRGASGLPAGRLAGFRTLIGEHRRTFTTQCSRLGIDAVLTRIGPAPTGE